MKYAAKNKYYSIVMLLHHRLTRITQPMIFDIIAPEGDMIMIKWLLEHNYEYSSVAIFGILNTKNIALIEYFFRKIKFNLVRFLWVMSDIESNGNRIVLRKCRHRYKKYLPDVYLDMVLELRDKYGINYINNDVYHTSRKLTISKKIELGRYELWRISEKCSVIRM
jgi:hypothetical protein